MMECAFCITLSSKLLQISGEMIGDIRVVDDIHTRKVRIVTLRASPKNPHLATYKGSLM